MSSLAVSADPTRATTATWKPTAIRLTFGVILAVDAILKWLPGYRKTYISQLQQAAQGQPHWLHGWFHFWIKLNQGAPNLWVDITGLAETALALVLLLGIARRAGYLIGAVYMLFVWAVGEAFGGIFAPGITQSGITDVGTGIIYAIVFLALYLTAPAARHDRLALDATLNDRLPWWRHIAEPHRRDRVAPDHASAPAAAQTPAPAAPATAQL